MKARLCASGKATTTFRGALVVGLAVSALVLGLASPGNGQGKGNPNPGVLPPNSKAYGKTYGEWSVAWWQWAFSIPVPPDDPQSHPLFDETGENCHVGQAGPVWFLGGVFNVSGIVERNCTVPAGKALFFPIVNTECSKLEGNGITENELRACAEGIIDGTIELSCEVDGVPIKNLNPVYDDVPSPYRVQSPPGLFGFTLPEENLLQFFGVDAPAGTYDEQAAADGVYLLLAPLSRGQHEIHFHGEFPDFDFELDITYNLTVK